ncbi:malto-oligosyltrehalose synthase [Flaviaesturariibacter flavus]|uniref:4-alpha-glucanotransferase n=1 Tax=Flaviaesturariibacter flavus TaxID=2502780 RepID=A0A4R1BNM8_9BACT|nr:malto-oligosyltrehalose synthase [Flaviaesturariibacter flavus]TCJ19154.1 malto-oligosyltrehalose synthase [Flaviaesturariibacter flavus]
MTYNPVATYRIQFHKDFTLADLERQVDYLAALGIRTLYASPVFTAVPGSTHGYDALNPHEINPEIGTLDDLRRVSRKLREKGIGWLQDIVPNHMAYDTRNPWLRDMLEKGRGSAYAAFFDVTWNDQVASGHIMAPFLGKSLEDAINDGEISLALEDGRFCLRNYDSSYPLRLRSYETVLQGDGASDAIRQWLQQAGELRAIEDSDQYTPRFEELVLQLSGLLKNDVVSGYINERLSALNENKAALLELANDQVYRLCHWQETDGRINYRRFFTVNGLICLNQQVPEVFDTFHRFISELVQEGIFQGVRVDHVDGLYDPTAYLEQLRRLLGPECYIVVEKILEREEELPAAWPIEGTTGYEFLAQVNGILTDSRSSQAFTRYYYSLVPDHRTPLQQVRDKKTQILYHHMGGELENLYQLLMQLLQPEQYAQLRTEDLKTAIAEFLLHLPVYRWYGNALPLPSEESAQVHAVMEQARSSRPDLSPALGLLEHTLLHPEPDPVRAAAILHFYRRLMQLSGPLMAKGVEDTLMYTHFRFLGHNEVGDAPAHFGWRIEAFHQAMARRQAEWPLALNATSTHDTKRGEDVRARLQALSAMPEAWLEAVKAWMQERGADDIPDANDAYGLLQTLVGSYPNDDAELPEYRTRLEAFMEKALRESKRRSDWGRPDETYETAAKTLAKEQLASGSAFERHFGKLRRRVAEFGYYNSLIQLLLKCTCPGVPDVYQGCEGWDLSLVDPDNRRPVDYKLRHEWSAGKKAPGKFRFLQALLALRNADSELFTFGRYQPLRAEGKLGEQVLAFARLQEERILVVAVPLWLASLGERPDEIDWADTRIVLPEGTATDWTDAFGRRTVTAARGSLNVAELFERQPYAVLRGTIVEQKRRNAGLLLHITSLPAPFGIGDLGPEACRFADFLYRSGQSYWQLLPINPTEQGQGHSPYSSTSSSAGNRLLISPELLLQEGLVSAEQVDAARLEASDSVDYTAVEQAKNSLLQQAWETFRANAADADAFSVFCELERGWLDDFAAYSVLKKHHDGEPWYEWAPEWKLRDPLALARLEAESGAALEQVRWEQFIFSRQWQALRDYCTQRGIRLVGDLPFYVSYDSADVWAHRGLFRLDEEGARLGLAGVPPDAFSADGQLWGMPVFDWAALRRREYDWWIARLHRNLELFDIVRLDHFRAFAAYWEVPADAETAREGQWVEGPGAHFFETVKEQLGDLPFVAEDLGDIDAAVLQLRDRFSLPGMKVLQFAFGEDLSASPHIPHNYDTRFFVYTGTHDNNSTRGWWRTEADVATRARLRRYAGHVPDESSVAETLCRMALSSVAQTCILPVQDLLGLDEGSRMNTPASAGGNWGWRLTPGQLQKDIGRRLRSWTELYNRS